ncbi:sperm flagellar protein 1 isoform X2 [Panthera tigris]|uniref:sperm flagellar protein 1 isoform X2 n=1 Tax=Panthera tigris TaxID=9694 RepID=UPI001C6F6F4D|nr:sperm flagellar protein 1 isoform X2 [Panthera tigris]
MAGSVDEEALHQLYLPGRRSHQVLLPQDGGDAQLCPCQLSPTEAQQLGSPKQEGAEQAELLGTRGRDAQDRAMRARRGGVSAHSAEAAPGGAPEAQEAGRGLLTGAGSPGWHWLHGCGFVPEGPRGRWPGLSGRRAAQIAEKEQELLASQETVQVLQMKVRRLEHLLQLKNVRIDDLSRRLQQAERKQRRMDRFAEPRSHVQRLGMLPKAMPDTRGPTLVLPALGLRGRCPDSVHTPRNRSPPSPEDCGVSIRASSLRSGPRGKLPEAAEGEASLSGALTWGPTRGWRAQQLERKG